MHGNALLGEALLESHDEVRPGHLDKSPASSAKTEVRLDKESVVLISIA